MIKKVTLKNYRCFRELQLGLQPFTVLVGPNSSGKSAFLEAVQFACQASRLSSDDPAIVRSAFAGPDDDVSVNFELESNEPATVFCFSPLARTIDSRTIPNTLRGVHFVNFQQERIQDQKKLSFQERTELTSDGSNLCDVLYNLRDGAPEKFEAIQKELQSFEPAFTQVIFDTSTRQRDEVQKPVTRLAYQMTLGGKTVTLPVSNVSAGLRLFTAFSTLRHLVTGYSVLLVEQPETGFHPSKLSNVFESLKALTKGPKPTQVILTTHSPYFLDMCEKDDVIVFFRNDDGSCAARPFEQIKDIDKLLESFDIGQLWASTPERDLFMCR